MAKGIEMTKPSGLLAGLAVGAALLTAAGSASATTSLKLGTEQFTNATADFTDVLTFSITGPTALTLTGLDIAPPSVGNVTFELLSPTDTVLASDMGVGGVFFLSMINDTVTKAGVYSLEEIVTGSAGASDVTLSAFGAPLAIPEPATWAVMLIGFGGIGASIRKARGQRSAAVTA
jgi:hypothetical protein